MVDNGKDMSIIFTWIFQQNLSWEAQKNPGNLWGVGNKQLQGTQYLLHSFLHPTEIAAPQQPVTAWKMNIPEPRWEHVFRRRWKKMKEGTMLQIKPKDSIPAWNQTQKGKNQCHALNWGNCGSGISRGY